MKDLLIGLTMLAACGPSYTLAFSGAKLRPGYRLIYCVVVFLCGLTVGLRVRL